MDKVSYFLCTISLLLITTNAFSQRIHGHACFGELELLDSLLKSGRDINAGNPYDKNRSLLYYAVACRQAEVFEYLLEKGADVNILDDDKSSPLFAAVRMNNTEMAKTLIEHNAAVSIVDTSGITPLHLSVLNKQLDITKLLIKQGSNIHAVNKRGNNPITIAVREGSLELFHYLVEQGADTNTLNIPLLKGEYLGQEPPGLKPKLFAPNFISTEHIIQNAIFHPNGEEFYFTKIIPGQNYNEGTIMVTRKEFEIWSPPVPADIPGNYREVDPFITPDGKRLFYCTNRPIHQGDSINEDVDIWVLEREGRDWSSPKHLGDQLNTAENDWFPSFSNRGTLYYAKIGASNDIYYSTFENGQWQEGIAMGDSINCDFIDYDPFIAPDESYLIFASGRPGGFGNADLYISFKKEDGSWSEAKNMGESINSASIDLAPSLSPDGKFLFFSSGRGDSVDLYWIDAQIIDSLR